MKHLKKFENFENLPIAKFQLEENEVDDLHEQFDLFVEDMERSRGEAISHRELQDIFAVDEKGEISDDFVRFLDYLEENTDWFSYNLMDKVKNDVCIIVAKMGVDYEDEMDDVEWAEDDPNWPYEEEESTFSEEDLDEEDEDDIETIKYKSSTQLNLDDILDKINDSGYDSLTDEEKEFLQKQENKRISNFYKFIK